MLDSAPLPIYKEMKVQVTQRHIDEGQKGDCLRCALSLAVLDAAAPLPEGSFAVVVPGCEGKPLITITAARYPGTNHFLTLSPESEDVVRTFIDRFDRGYPVEPFEFEASVHPPV